MKEIVQLAIGGRPDLGARASATLTDLMAASGVQVARTGSVVLEWPNPLFVSDHGAWEHELPVETDPVAFAFRRLQSPSGASWTAPVDAVRSQVADWLRGERLRITPPWPAGATCAIALVHEAHPFPVERRGLRGALTRAPREPGITAYERVATVERRHRVTSALRSIDLLQPAEQAQLRALGFALDTPAGIQLAVRPGFRRGTAFPTRGYDHSAERSAEWVELPLLGDQVDAGLATLLDVGGGAAVSIRIERFAGEHGDEEAVVYDELLERLISLGASLTTPAELVRRLYA